ncbi:MAG: hypothetical protein KKC37_16860, partial [Proteobacteria bacterium]|nr:hypothetical protein [Pseudomonadota bacterium]
MASRPSPADSSGAHLTLVGVVHLDPEGEAKLAGLLQDLRPDLISLQISPFAIRWRRARAPELAARLARNAAL